MAQVGYGTKVEYKVGAGAYVELSDVLDLEPPTPKVKMAEYQPLRTTRWKRKKVSTGEVSDLKITMVHVAATFLTLSALLFDETLTWRITRSDTTSTEIFLGHIAELPRKIKVDDIDALEIIVAVDSSITFA